METTITMTAREQHRAWVLAKVLTGELTMIEGAERLGLSERHLWRLRTAFERAGPAGLASGVAAPTATLRQLENPAVDPDRVVPGDLAAVLEDEDAVGRALVELGIGSIVAGSPQAKGRIERLWGTFQDRLVVELRLAGVTDRAGANAVLATYLPRHNARGPIG